jgi:hypothetical protein
MLFALLNFYKCKSACRSFGMVYSLVIAATTATRREECGHGTLLATLCVTAGQFLQMA